MTNRHLVFVYGSLKSGCYNNLHLATATPMGPARTVERYLLLDGRAFPFLINPAHLAAKADLSGWIGHVKGELYAVDDATLATLDRLESHPRFYKREEVAVTFAEPAVGVQAMPWVYFLNTNGRRFDPTHGAAVCRPDADGNVEWIPHDNSAALDATMGDDNAEA